MAEEIKKGNVVSIFQDPITEEDFEGDALLIECLNEDCGKVNGRILQRWKVRFANAHPPNTYEDEVFERKILVPKIY